MKLHEKILKDPEYQTMMKKIDEVCDPKIHDSFTSQHGLKHAKNVMSYAVDFLQQLGATEQTIELTRVAALLHDIALQDGDKGDHAKNGSNMARRYLKKYDLPIAEVDLISHAIAWHSEGSEITNNIDIAVLLGDKLDVAKDRIRVYAPWTIHAALRFLNKAEFIVGKKVATLRYTVQDGFDIERFNDWPKAVTIPAKVASFMNKDFILEIGNDKYSEEEFLELINEV